MLEIAVFLCGAVVMVIELTGSRVLAPYLGTSLVVWTSLIGVVLAALSLGYWWGGRLADRRPEVRLLSRIVFLAAAATALLGLSKAWVLAGVQDQGGGLYLAAVTATVVLFAPPAILLGMVAPFAVRLKMRDADSSGRTAGNLYALSTLGSIAGTFLAGFVLIAWVGSTNILFLMAVVLVVAAALVHRSGLRAKALAVAVFAGLLVLSLARDAHLAGIGFVDTDTSYNRVLVYGSVEEGRPVRALVTGPGAKQSAMYPEAPAELAMAYTRYYRLARHFAPGLSRVLVLGGGGYSFPKYMLAHWPGVSVDVVELDPGITALAREHFALRDDPRLRVLGEDGRTFLNRNGEKYDAVLCDVFTSSYAIPFHLATVEAVQRVRAALKPDGVVLVNLLSALEGDDGRLYRALFATYAAVFPRVEAFSVGDPGDGRSRINVILAAFMPGCDPGRPAGDPETAAMLGRRLPVPAADVPAMTDEYAPVDRYVASGFGR